MNQALEDVYSLTLLLTATEKQIYSGVNGTDKGNSNRKILDALSFWQEMRQRRIDAIFDWVTNSQNVQRMPEAERKRLLAEGRIKEGAAGEGDDMSWLYRPSLEEEVNDWLKDNFAQ